jgi:hypothetical protein
MGMDHRLENGHLCIHLAQLQASHEDREDYICRQSKF